MLLFSVTVGIGINSDNQLVPLNTNATFHCTDVMHTFQTFLVAFVDEAILDASIGAEVDLLAERNVFVDSTGLNLFVLATEENNGTMIQCRDASLLGMIDFSERLTLTVIGMHTLRLYCMLMYQTCAVQTAHFSIQGSGTVSHGCRQ